MGSIMATEQTIMGNRVLHERPAAHTQQKLTQVNLPKSKIHQPWAVRHYFLCTLLKQGQRRPAACFVKLIKSPFQERKLSHPGTQAPSHLNRASWRHPYWYPNFPSLPTLTPFPHSTTVNNAFHCYNTFFKTYICMTSSR